MEVVSSGRWVDHLHIVLFKNVLVVVVNTVTRDEFILVAKQKIPFSSA